jgi:hypothetical protein
MEEQQKSNKVLYIIIGVLVFAGLIYLFGFSDLMSASGGMGDGHH